MTAPALAALRGRYDAVNIKLDKTGGLTEALAMAQEARELGFAIMAGCMVGTSLGMAPAVLIGQIGRLSSTSTGRCCWRGTASPGFVTRARRCIRRRRSCGAE